MSYYDEKLVKRSQRGRRCIGCENFPTIAKGDSYYSCWFADGGEWGRYALCVECHDHLYGSESQKACESCKSVMERDGEVPRSIRECRREEEKKI